MTIDALVDYAGVMEGQKDLVKEKVRLRDSYKKYVRQIYGYI